MNLTNNAHKPNEKAVRMNVIQTIQKLLDKQDAKRAVERMELFARLRLL